MMNGSSSEEVSLGANHKKYKGVRRRKWGKWVSEIRVPGTQDRLWLGSYATPEAAAVAHDIAFFCLRGTSTSPTSLNFPHYLPPGLPADLSPRSIQRAASDAGMAIDSQLQVATSQQSSEYDAASAAAAAAQHDQGSGSVCPATGAVMGHGVEEGGMWVGAGGDQYGGGGGQYVGGGQYGAAGAGGGVGTPWEGINFNALVQGEAAGHYNSGDWGTDFQQFCG